MKAIVKTEKGLGAEAKIVSEPKIGRNEVLVKMKASSICGTDIHIWEWDEWAQNRIKKLPLILGHEFSGEVVETGKDVVTLKEGDMISAETHIVDGTCYQCRTDRMHVCQNLEILGVDRNGVFAEFVALPERNVWKNDPNLDPSLASIQEPLGNAVQSTLPKNHVEDIVGKNVAVLGCGPIGLMAIATLKTTGASKIFATAGGFYKKRMTLAEKMGADLVLSAKIEKENLVNIIRDATDGNGVDVVLEMSGAPSAVRQAFELLTPGGRVSLLGLLNKTMELDLNNSLIFKAATVYGISGRRMFQTWYQMKRLLSNPDFRRRISLIITHRIPIKDIAEGVNLILSKQAGKVVLESKW